MSIVAFWSPMHGRGTTTACLSISLKTALDYNCKCLMTHTQLVYSSMETVLLDKMSLEDNKAFTDKGLDSVVRLSKSGYLSPKEFTNYCDTLYKGRLDFLRGSVKSDRSMFKENKKGIVLLKISKEAYDFSFVDVNSGVSDEITKAIIDISDIIIVCLDQSEALLKNYADMNKSLLEGKKIVYLINRYDRNSKCSTKYIENKYKLKNLAPLNYCTDLLDSLNNHEVANFFYKNNKAVLMERDMDFFTDVTELCNYITKNAEQEVVESKLGKFSISSLFKNGGKK